jgi:hypothetical protein
MLIMIPTYAVDTLLNGLFVKTGLIKVVGAVIDTLGMPKFFNWRDGRGSLVFLKEKKPLHKFEYFSIDKSIDVDGIKMTDLNENYSWWNTKQNTVLSPEEFYLKVTENGTIPISEEDKIILNHLENRYKVDNYIYEVKDKIQSGYREGLGLPPNEPPIPELGDEGKGKAREVIIPKDTLDRDVYAAASEGTAKIIDGTTTTTAKESNSRVGGLGLSNAGQSGSGLNSI